MPTPRKSSPLMMSFALTPEDKSNVVASADVRQISRSALIRHALRNLFVSDGLTVTSKEPETE